MLLLRRCVLVVVGIVAFVLVTNGLAAVARHAAPGPPNRPAHTAEPMTVRVVQPGETLWSIAAALPGHGDVRSVVDRLVSANGGSEVRAGDTISIPVALTRGGS
jgi:hypothetical protein